MLTTDNKYKNKGIEWEYFNDETFLISVLESIHDALVVVDINGTIIYANPAYTRVLGVNTKKVIGRTIDNVAPEAIIRKVLNKGAPIIREPSRILSLGIDIVVNCTPIFKNGKLVGAVSVFKDVTEVKMLSEALERMKEINDYLQDQLYQQKSFPEEFKEIIGKNGSFREVLFRAAKAARSDVTVMIRGETGTGKELIAKAIHNAGKRRNGPFIKINFAAIPESLLESELFGYEEGAFTGAKKGGKMGKFELAKNGTLFLDEIGDMSMVLQAKLLRALQEKEIERVGGNKTIQTDVRIIAATNQDLEKKVKEKKFREDLFYRLNVFGICSLPLRERKDDIPLLIDYFLKKTLEKEKKKELKISHSVYKLLCKYSWPGNIRELQNVVASAVVSCEGNYIQIKDLPEYLVTLSKHNLSTAFDSIGTKTLKLNDFFSPMKIGDVSGKRNFM
jgi:PAS domain S-box-containing protein